MINEKEVQVNFSTAGTSLGGLAQEVNDMKMILLSIAVKLDEQSRKQLIKELSGIQRPAVQQWVNSLAELDKN